MPVMGRVVRARCAVACALAALTTVGCSSTAPGAKVATGTISTAASAAPTPVRRSTTSRQTVVQLWPASTSVVWAWTADLTGADAGQTVLRSRDGGLHWSTVTPSGFAHETGTRVIGRLFVLDPSHAWLVAGGVASGSQQDLLATADSGLHWRLMGRLPGLGCDIDFVTSSVGWCVGGLAAAGSQSVTVYFTRDEGRRWQLVSRSATPSSGTPAHHGQLPFGCDKALTFASLEIGWAAFACAGGMPPLYRSTDGGRTWLPVSVAPVTGQLDGGSGWGTPVLAGTDAAEVLHADQPARTIIYRSRDSGSTWDRVIAPTDHRSWLVDLVTATDWRLIDGNALLGTDNAGATWFRLTMSHSFSPASLAGLPSTHIFITADGGYINAVDGAWHTSDGGRTWERITVPGT